MYRGPIFDSHHHLWDLDAIHYPWLMAKGVPRFFGDPTPIQRNYLSQDLSGDYANHNVTGSVHIQVGAALEQSLAEAKWVDAQATAFDYPTKQVAFCDLSADSADQDLASLAELSSVAGVRQIVGRSPQEDAQTGTDSLIAHPQFKARLSQLAKSDWSFDLQLIPEQMSRVASLLENIDTPVALVHCGSPWYKEGEGFKCWKDGVRALAERPLTHVKLSGLVMFNHDWTKESIRPFIDHIVDSFGVERVMFGSNFPVDKLHASFDQLIKAYSHALNGLNAGQFEDIFHNNGRGFYRI